MEFYDVLEYKKVALENLTIFFPSPLASLICEWSIPSCSWCDDEIKWANECQGEGFSNCWCTDEELTSDEERCHGYAFSTWEGASIVENGCMNILETPMEMAREIEHFWYVVLPEKVIVRLHWKENANLFWKREFQRAFAFHFRPELTTVFHLQTHNYDVEQCWSDFEKDSEYMTKWIQHKHPGVLCE